MIRIAVCDDQREVCEQIAEVIDSCPEIETQTDMYTDSAALLASKVQYDILFLDIDMPGKNGIETAKEIRRTDKRVKIIYVTNYGGYAGYAFGVHAFGYLLKPVRREAICRQLKEACQYFEEEKKTQQMEFDTEDGVHRVDVKDIQYFEYQNRRVTACLTKGSFSWKGRIADCLERMEPYGFAMPHKSFVVNLYQVQSVRGYEIELISGQMIPLSQKKAKEFRETLSSYLADRIARNI